VQLLLGLQRLGTTAVVKEILADAQGGVGVGGEGDAKGCSGQDGCSARDCNNHTFIGLNYVVQTKESR